MSERESESGVAEVLVEVRIEAPPASVWRALVVETSAWWQRDFYTVPDPVGFRIEARLGGRMYEDWGGGSGQLWGQVAGLRAPEYLQVVGDSSREWGGPSRNIMTWRLEPEGGGTRLRLEHAFFGRVSEATRASLDEGWRRLFEGSLKPFVEGGAVPEGAGSPS